MKYAIGISALALALAGCGNEVTTGDADTNNDGEVSMAEGAEIAKASGLKPQPGKYKVTSNMGGMTTNVEYCLTPAEAEAGFEDMLSEGQQGDCKYEEFNLSGGKVDATMVCATEMGDMRMEMDGDVGPTSSDLKMTMKGDMGGMKMDMTVNMKQERIGDCDG